MEKFFIGLHQEGDAWAFQNCMISFNRLQPRGKRTGRVNNFRVNDWILDSGAFTEISKYGKWRTSTDQYLEGIYRWEKCGNLLAAVTQDLMCEPFILEKTGLSVGAHQEETIRRYIEIEQWSDTYIMPVLQGFLPSDYAAHLRQYGNLLPENAWVGVGSVCRRNGDPEIIEEVLLAIKSERSDLQLHGFGLKLTALKNRAVQSLLYSSDSMAWCRKNSYEKRNGNDPRDALRYAAQVQTLIDRPVLANPLLYQWWV